ncbi:hypothetical protein [Novipirellula sp.]|uniref:hypothetical protein n=1 Tax=Novipirellula sp. TaxID=2795430 RepID=UPI003562546E
MIHCPHLSQDNACEVAGQMAGCKVRTTPSACNACQANENRRAINLVTIGMAVVNKRRRKQDTRERESLLRNYLPERAEPETIKIDRFRPGPGNELKRMLAWFAKPSETCNCETRVDTMNDWGAEGCHIEKLKVAVAEDCMVVHAHVGAKPYGDLRCRPKFRKLGLRKHGFHSMRYPGGGIVHA